MSHSVRSPFGGWIDKRTNKLRRRLVKNGHGYDVIIYIYYSAVCYRSLPGRYAR